MDVQNLIPPTSVIPLPWGLAEVFMIAGFVIHILFMNMIFGAGLFALVHSLHQDKNNPTPKAVSKLLPTGVALTVNFGVVPLLFMQVLYGHLFYISDVLMALWWLGVIFVLILAYYSAYVFDFAFDRLARVGRLLTLTLFLVSMLYVSFLFSNNFTLMLTPELWPAYFDHPGGTLLNLTEPTLLPRWLHFVVASIAVGGLAVALYWTERSRRGKIPAGDALPLIQSGMRWFAWGSAAQVVVGLWFLVSLPQTIMLQFMGQDGLSTAIFILGLCSAILVLIFAFQSKPWASAGALLTTVLIMAILRELVRAAYLATYFKVSDLPVAAQISPILLFLVALVGGVLVMVWVLKAAAQTGQEG